MSRAAVYGTLLATAVVVVSCARSEEGATGFAAPKTPLKLNVSCMPGNAINLSLVDQSGNPAWVAQTVGREIKWEVDNHVTINGVVGKHGQPLPMDTDPIEHGGTGGRPFKAKVKPANGGGPQSGATLPYSLDVTCTQNGNTVNLIIDPEFIVRP
jgi:hypothetical protein